MLIRRAEIAQREIVDLRIAEGRVAEISRVLAASADEVVLDAQGHALLPGLHDHHLHLRALAAAMASVRCGPPQITSTDAFIAALQAAHRRLAPGEWLRGIGFHESIVAVLDRDWLDAVVPDRPLRIQHRSGRMWVFNSAALDRLAPDLDAPLERSGGRWTGRLLDADDWLRAQLQGTPPGLHAASRYLASRGVTGVTDTTHHNGPEALKSFAEAQACGELLQTVRVMGDARLDRARDVAGVQRGEHKFHLHEHDLPELDTLVAAIRASRAQGRASAFHCVTRTELVYALAALREAGASQGDRIEHAAVSPPELVDDIAAMKLIVVTQPNFIAERGDDYLRDVELGDQPWLYRLSGFLDAGVPLALSTDAPFGEADPWAAMQAAMQRRTASGACIGDSEALTAAQALDGFLSPLQAPGHAPRRPAVGVAADLCLLDREWAAMYRDLAGVQVHATMKAGQVIYSGSE